nr:aldehyde dehydrogenase family protein [Halarchaeum acidiphilum]
MGDIRENHRDAIEEATQDLTVDHWIDGESVASANGERFETSDPAIDEPIVDVAQGTESEIDDAVEAAEAALRSWKETTPRERDDIIREWTSTLRDHLDELALLESLDTGKPLAYARDEAKEAFNYLEYYVSVAQAHEGSELPVGPDNHAYVRQEPSGSPAKYCRGTTLCSCSAGRQARRSPRGTWSS